MNKLEKELASSKLLEQAIAKLKEQLEWRGPSGKESKYVVLERHHAAALWLLALSRECSINDTAKVDS